jgi:hypothetical protein
VGLKYGGASVLVSETQPAEGAEVPVFIIEMEACKSGPRLARPQPTGRLTEDSDGGRNQYRFCSAQMRQSEERRALPITSAFDPFLPLASAC